MTRILKQIAAFSLILVTLACTASKVATRPAPASGVPAPTKPDRAPEPDAPKEAYQRGLAYLEQGQFQKAQALFEELAASNVKQGTLYNALGVIYRRQGMLEKAISAYKRALSLQDRYVEAHYNLGIAYRESGRFQDAETEYHLALAFSPNFAPAHYNLGVLYDLYLNRPAEALKHYKEYKRLTGGSETLDVWITDLERRLESPAAAGMAQSKGESK